MLKKAKFLTEGDMLLLSFEKTATIKSVKVGTRFVNFETEYGKSRVEKEHELLVRQQFSEEKGE